MEREASPFMNTLRNSLRVAASPAIGPSTWIGAPNTASARA